MILLLMALGTGLGIGYTVGSVQTVREARADRALLVARCQDLRRLLNECNGVKYPPVEAKR